MSSVDLHTHSGFQCMLPESFAVVCAPNSTPKYAFHTDVPWSDCSLSILLRSFGIFRLTDPPGLKTILECEVKEAFHPHPERPIYTVRELQTGFIKRDAWADTALTGRRQRSRPDEGFAIGDRRLALSVTRHFFFWDHIESGTLQQFRFVA